MALRHRRDLVTEPGVIVVDGVYINGAVARLAEVVEVAEASGSVLVVDETHSFGVTPGGLGVCEEVGVVDRVHFRAIGLSFGNDSFPAAGAAMPAYLKKHFPKLAFVVGTRKRGSGRGHYPHRRDGGGEL